MPYELLDHTADAAILVREPSLEDLFRTAARAMFEIMLGAAPAGGEETEITAEGADEEDLLRNFLAELLYRFSADGAILSPRTVAVSGGTRVSARCASRRFDPDRDALETELKAVTYHQLEVRRRNNEWTARVVFDV